MICVQCLLLNGRPTPDDPPVQAVAVISGASVCAGHLEETIVEIQNIIQQHEERYEQMKKTMHSADEGEIIISLMHTEN